MRIHGPPVACSFGIGRAVRGQIKTGLVPRVLRGIAPPRRCRLLRVGHVDKFVGHTGNAKEPAGGSHHDLRRFAAPRCVSSLLFSFSVRSRRKRS